MPVKPMLAGKYDPAKVAQQLPILAQPKLDGIRMLIDNGVGYSRSLKRIPNVFVQKRIQEIAPLIQGLDGELVLGSPTAPDAYRLTNSAVMSHGGVPDVTFHVFDSWENDAEYQYKFHWLKTNIEGLLRANEAAHWLRLLPVTLCNTMEDITAYEAALLAEGHEGVILRGMSSKYKNGRATPSQGQLIKIKRFKDAEAVVHGFQELLHNGNEATTSETGHTVRSAHQDNKVPMNTLGALLCTGKWDDGTPFDVKIGTGFDEDTRQEIWDNQDSYFGRLVKFKYFEVGVKDAPRHPVFLGFRSPEDT